MGHSLGTHATMTQLLRTKQGPFGLDDCVGVRSSAEEVRRSEERSDEL